MSRKSGKAQEKGEGYCVQPPSARSLHLRWSLGTKESIL